MRSHLLLLALAAVVSKSSAFVNPRGAIAPSPTTALSAKKDGLDGINIPNPFTEIADMFTNLDDVIDDFFNKRMGNGEVFYGKRKYKPSGKIESEYNGGGFSDWRKIEAARQFREERAMVREEAKREQQQQNKQ
mmetsp:Transcript_10579/g.22774  ORF Transcript_10579/g.22774 Transcript_10579/m.22774 type:complete len:134 (+) Transcript_10579:80-481(+)